MNRRRQREFIELSRSYRDAIREAKYEAARANGKLERLARLRAFDKTLQGDLRLLIEIDAAALHACVDDPMLLRIISDKILRAAHGLHHDRRGDLRQTEIKRLLGVRGAM